MSLRKNPFFFFLLVDSSFLPGSSVLVASLDASFAGAFWSGLLASLTCTGGGSGVLLGSADFTGAVPGMGSDAGNSPLGPSFTFLGLMMVAPAVDPESVGGGGFVVAGCALAGFSVAAASITVLNIPRNTS